MPVVLRYTLLRLSLLAAVGLLAYAVGLRGVWWLLVTAVVSILLSMVLLRGPREQMTQAILDRQQQRGRSGTGRGTGGRLSRGLDADAAAEDADDDRRRRDPRG